MLVEPWCESLRAWHLLWFISVWWFIFELSVHCFFAVWWGKKEHIYKSSLTGAELISEHACVFLCKEIKNDYV